MKPQLIRLLQNAHAGERAAAFAYNGHWRSVRGAERTEIQKIEKEEWDHRAELFKMIKELGAKPRALREFGMMIVGVCIFTLCRLGDWLNVAGFGWYTSMYGAGKLERGNIVEYEVAARYAHEAGYPQFVECLLVMAEVEWDHELFFRSKCLKSNWRNYIKLWDPPPARAAIREQFKFALQNTSDEIPDRGPAVS